MDMEHLEMTSMAYRKESSHLKSTDIAILMYY